MFSGRDMEAKLLKQHESQENMCDPDEKIGFSDKGIGNQRDSDVNLDGSQSKPSKFGSQELTLSYLCDNNSKLNFSEKDVSGKVSLTSVEKVNHHKGKEVAVDSSNQDDRWVVERDFLQLSETRAQSSKREVEEEVEREKNRGEKKAKIETLSLSLGLPDVSLSLTASKAVQYADPPAQIKPRDSSMLPAPSNNNTQTTCSNDYTAASMSFSYSRPFSHNPSCSLTHNSTENHEYSMTDQIWNCGEGTNGSVHSRFKPIGDGVGLSNHGGGVFSMMQGSLVMNKDSCNNNSLHRTTSSDNISFFPSELPARRNDAPSENSRGRGSENVRGLDSLGGGRGRRICKPERILWEIVSESIPVMAQIIQELTDETIELTKECLKNLIVKPERREELMSFQSKVESRSDLTNETLLKANKNQLEILVAIKTGLGSFLSSKNRLATSELMEIFLFLRCRNVNCKSMLPVDDCDCKICLENKGFCSSCMCPVCLTFDCASNTCSWIGCDVCSHWCHAACGIQRNLIKPGPSLKGPSGTTEMQFHCLGCGHASEIFGFVKDVFLCCAKDWGLETLKKELDCVIKIFKGSNDYKGKELQMKAEDMLSKLESTMISPSDACSFIIQFFDYETADLPAPVVSLQDAMAIQARLRKDAAPNPPHDSLLPKHTIYNIGSSSLGPDLLRQNFHQKDLRATLLSDLKTENELRSGNLSKKDGFESLESLVRIKEAEARMFQIRADEAQREAEGYRKMIKTTSEKLEEEYAHKLSKLCLQETEERRRKNLEELKILENSHCDYYKMKMRMQADIAGLLERMEATKHKWV